MSAAPSDTTNSLIFISEFYNFVYKIRNMNKPWIWILLALAGGAAAALGWRHFQPSPPSAPDYSQPAPSAPAAANVLTLPQAEALVRAEAANISANPIVADWLRQEDVLRRFAAAVDAIACGRSPRESLSFMRPKHKFAVLRRLGEIFISPRAYARYDLAAGALASVNMERTAALIQRIEPALQEAYDELGHGRGTFRAALNGAINELLRVPTVTGDIALRAKIASYPMKDERLENLSLAQKHLLRMGPANIVKIQEQLRVLAQSLQLSVPAAGR
jgi:hypothetical protein